MRRPLLALVALGLAATACSATGPAAADPTRAGAAEEATTTSTAPATTAPATTSTTIATTITTSTTSTSTTTTTTTLPPPPPLVLGFAGDTSFTHGLHARDPFGDIADVLAAPDVMFVNLETTVAEEGVGTRVDKEFTFKSPPESVALLVEAGIDAVQLANNHTLDFEEPALLRTLELLDAGGIAHSGAGPDEAAAYSPRFIEAADRTVGFVSFSRVPCGWSASGVNSRPMVAWTCDAFVDLTIAAVEAAAAGADIVVVMVHWGIERDRCPQRYQRDLAAAWSAAGADLIIGGHPHVLQGVERIGDAWVVHSTGNFAFPSAREASADSAVFEFTFHEHGIDLRAIPVRIVSGRPQPASAERAAAILDTLSTLSFGYAFFDDGTAVPTTVTGSCG